MKRFSENAQAQLEEWKNELCNRWYSELQNTYESITERDNIVEDIGCKELLFTLSGTVLDDGELV